MPPLLESVFTNPHLCASTEDCSFPLTPKDAFGLRAHYCKSEESVEA